MSGHGEGTCEHDHDCSDAECGNLWTLYKSVDTHKVTCLNEREDGSCQKVFKAWHDRLSTDDVLESNEDDGELLLHVPFTSDVKIKSICVIGGAGGTGPAKLRVWVNRTDIDFAAAADSEAVQEWDLGENSHGHLEYATKAAKFQGVGSLTMYFPESLAGEDESTRIHFIGFKGEATGNRRDGVTTFVYEALPQPGDHKRAEDSLGAGHMMH